MYFNMAYHVSIYMVAVLSVLWIVYCAAYIKQTHIHIAEQQTDTSQQHQYANEKQHPPTSQDEQMHQQQELKSYQGTLTQQQIIHQYTVTHDAERLTGEQGTKGRIKFKMDPDIQSCVTNLG